MSSPSYFLLQPVPTLILITAAGALYSWVKGPRVIFYSSLIVLLIALSYVGFWYMTAEQPLENVVPHVSIYRVATYPESGYPLNTTRVDLILNFSNPSGTAAPRFFIENPSISINDTLVRGISVYCSNGTVIEAGFWSCGTIAALTLGAGSSAKLWVTFWVHNITTPDVVWRTITHHFTVTLSAYLTLRPYFQPDLTGPSVISGDGYRVLALRRFSTSAVY